MRGKNYSTEGVVLKRKNYSEGDRILTVFSKHHGKIALIAKGVRKLRSRKRGSLEVFSRLKFSGARGKNMDIITEAELIDSYKPIRADLRRTAVSYFFIEMVDKLIQEEEVNHDLYMLLTSRLKMLEKSRNLKEFRTNFIKDCLVLLGFWPVNKRMEKPDEILMRITERDLSSKRIGKQILN